MGHKVYKENKGKMLLLLCHQLRIGGEGAGDPKYDHLLMYELHPCTPIPCVHQSAGPKVRLRVYSKLNWLCSFEDLCFGIYFTLTSV